MRVIVRDQKIAGEQRRGVAATEFAFVLPVLVTLVLGCVDLGRFAHSYIALANAARAGAGYGSVRPYDVTKMSQRNSEIRQTVEEELSALGDFNSSRLSVTTNYTVESDGLWRVSVEATYPFEMVVRWPGLPDNLTMRHVAVMRGIR